MRRGTVVRLIRDRGFGFLRVEDGSEVFFHHSAMNPGEFDSLQEGQELEFTIAILPAKGDKTKPDYFVMVLKKVGSGRHARWLVDQWVPRDTPPIPANPVG